MAVISRDWQGHAGVLIHHIMYWPVTNFQHLVTLSTLTTHLICESISMPWSAYLLLFSCCPGAMSENTGSQRGEWEEPLRDITTQAVG